MVPAGVPKGPFFDFRLFLIYSYLGNYMEGVNDYYR